MRSSMGGIDGSVALGPPLGVIGALDSAADKDDDEEREEGVVVAEEEDIGPLFMLDKCSCGGAWEKVKDKDKVSIYTFYLFMFSY